ncbi:MAG: NUDIX hydrolase [Gammaproteobacteria bacterium]
MRDLIERKLKDTAPPDDPLSVVPFNTPGDLPSILRLLGRKRMVPAAVLVPLVERPEGLAVLLTQRAKDLKHHPGQISFPGGRIEDTDSGPAAAAVREAHEEVGLEPRFVEVRGYLDSYLTITGYTVTPVVAFVRPGFSLVPDQVEVTEAFEVPLEFLMDPANHVRRMRTVFDRVVTIYEIRYRERNIWGATAGMLINMYEKIFKS